MKALYAVVLMHFVTVAVSLTSCVSTNPLIIPTREGNVEAVKKLITSGEDVNARDSLGFTVLMYASSGGHTEIVKELIAKGADVNAKSTEHTPFGDGGYTSLLFASQNNHTEVVKELIAKGADVNAKENLGNSTALMLASLRGNAEIINELIENGTNIDAKSIGGSTALSFASRKGHLEAVQKLLARGADVNTRTKYGETPLMFASKWGHVEIVKELIIKGADVNVKSTGGGQTDEKVPTDTKNAQVDKKPIATGVNENQKEDDYVGGPTMVIIEVEVINKMFSSAYKSKDSDVNVKQKDGLTAMSLAKREGHLGIIKLLKEAGAME